MSVLIFTLHCVFFQEDTKRIEEDLNFSKSKLEEYEEMVSHQHEERTKIEQQYQEDINNLKEQNTSLQEISKDKQKRFGP